MGEIVAVTQVDDTLYNGGEPGTMTLRLASIYGEMTASEGYAIVSK